MVAAYGLHNFFADGNQLELKKIDPDMCMYANNDINAHPKNGRMLQRYIQRVSILCRLL